MLFANIFFLVVWSELKAVESVPMILRKISKGVSWSLVESCAEVLIKIFLFDL